MADPTAEFFARLEEHGPDLMPPRARGSIRFDLEAEQRVHHWFVAINRGTVLVSQEKREADTVVTLDQGLFNRLAVGEAQVVAAYNRNEVMVRGNLPLLLMFRRVFPAPPGTCDPRDRVRERFGHPAGIRDGTRLGDGPRLGAGARRGDGLRLGDGARAGDRRSQP